MSKKIIFITLLALIVTGIAGRLLPHPWNTTPIVGVLLFSSVYLGFRYSMLTLIAVMVVSDVLLGTYQWQIMASVYASLVLTGILGWLASKNKSFVSVVSATLGSSIIFFVVTNWAVWQFGTMYPYSLAGLMQSYSMAIPFFKNSLVGDLFYTGLIFGSYEFVKYFVAKRSQVLQTPHLYHD